MKKFKRFLTIGVLLSVVFSGILCSCNKTNNEEDVGGLQILYQDVAEMSVFKRDQKDQIVQIPLIVNKKFSELSVEKIIGENINEDAFVSSCDFNTEYQANYQYIITLTFDASNAGVSEGDTVISSLKINIDGQSYDYDFGELTIIDTVAKNENEDIEFRRLGTGYADLSCLNFTIAFNNDIKITQIGTTSNLKLLNVEQYYINYYKGNESSFTIEVDSSEYNNLYYLFDEYIRYEVNGQEYIYYFSIMSVQTDLTERLETFINNQ